MRRVFLAAALAALVLAAGCGGSSQTASTTAGEVAGLVPAGAPVVLALETDPESEQWQRAEALLDRFPGKQRLLDAIREELADEGLNLEQDVLPALGDETFVVFLDLAGGGDSVVVLTQPRDPQKLKELLAEADEPTATREVDGWTLIAPDAATLDRFTQEGERLEDADWFADAQERVEEEGLLTFYVNGPAVEAASRASLPAGCEPPEEGRLEFLAGVVSADDDGVRMRLSAKGESADAVVGKETLLDHVPAGVFAYLGAPGVDFARFGLGDQIRCAGGDGAAEAERMLGVSIEDVLELFAGGFAFYVRQAPIIPELTLLLEPEDASKALATLDSLAQRASPLFGGAVQERTIDGVQAKELRAGPVTVAWGSREGRIVVTTSAAGFAALTGEGDSLADDSRFREASEAAGVGDDDAVFAYLDLRSLLDLVRTIGGLAQGGVPPEVEANLAPLRSFLAWGDVGESDEAEVNMFLQIG